MAVSTTVINTVARRLRDNANLAYPRAVLIRFVDHTQRILNAHTKSFLVQIDPAGANFHTFSSVYKISTLFGTTVSSIEALYDQGTGGPGGKYIERIQWPTLSRNDPQWFRRSGTQLISWSTVGKDLLVLYPILNRPVLTGELSFTYCPAVPSTILDNGSNDIVLDDSFIPLLQDIVEVLGCLKGRRFSEASDPIARVEQALSALGIVYQTQSILGQV
jgi:hypothetical protein